MSKQNDHNETHEKMMRHLIKLAAKKKGRSDPNPLVACAIVKNGKIIAKGVHDRPGTDHAEIIALKKAGQKAKGATVYITLEPCSHWGKTPPCVDALIDAKVTHVIYAIDDPNPLVRKRRSRDDLEKAGIQVTSGVLKEEAKQLNEVYLKAITQHQPFVIIKAGMSLDGKIRFNNTKYITHETSLKDVHTIRQEVGAILVGINTMLEDNPYLDVRYNSLKKGHKNPRIIVIDPQLKTPIKAHIFSTNLSEKVILVTKKKQAPRHDKEVCWSGMFNNNDLNWNQLLDRLYKEGITSVLIEGGQYVFSSALSEQVVDKCIFYISPKTEKNKDNFLFINKELLKKSHTKLRFSKIKAEPLDQDVKLIAYPQYKIE